DLEGHKAFPFRLERRDIDDDPATRVGRFSDADGQHVAWDAKIFHRAGQRERIWRDDADRALEFDKRLGVEVFRVHDRRIHVREDAELIRHTHVVAVRRYTVANHAVAHLPVLIGL